MLNAILLPQSYHPLTVSSALGCETQIHDKGGQLFAFSQHMCGKMWTWGDGVGYRRMCFSEFRFVAGSFAWSSNYQRAHRLLDTLDRCTFLESIRWPRQQSISPHYQNQLCVSLKRPAQDDRRLTAQLQQSENQSFPPLKVTDRAERQAGLNILLHQPLHGPSLP